MDDPLYRMPTALICLVFAAILLAALEAGFRIGRARREATSGDARQGVGTMEAAVFGLFGLVLALTFSIVVSRADDRRLLLVQETNAIGTAYLRADVLAPTAGEQMRERLRSYVDARIEDAEAGADPSHLAAARERAAALQAELWDIAIAATRLRGDAASALVLASLNEVFDAQAARDAAMRAHLPGRTLLFLAAIATVASLVAGYGLGLAGAPQRIASGCFVALTVLVAFLIIDLDRPRGGMFRAPYHLLLELRDDLRAR